MGLTMKKLTLVAKLNSILVLLSIAINLDWELIQLNIKNVFLNGDFDEEIYTRMPPRFEEKGRVGRVCKQKKSFYGLKHSPWARFTKLDTTLGKLGYQ